MEHALLRTCEGPLRNAAGFRSRTVWDEARNWFLSSYPLLGAAAAGFRLVDDEETVLRMHIPVAAVHSELQEICVNPSCGLDLEEWKFVLAHEFLHAALRHDLRLEGRDPALWNVACDLVINSWLQDMQVGIMPEGSLYEDRFRGLSAGAAYDLLWEEIQHYTGPGSPCDILYGDGSSLDGLAAGELDDFYRSAMQRGLAWHQESGRGLVPAGLVEEIRALSRPPIRWDVELARWFDEQFTPPEKRRTYSPFSLRRRISRGTPGTVRNDGPTGTRSLYCWILPVPCTAICLQLLLDQLQATA